MNTWIILITSLPTENATARMRAWRSLKASGAAVLRDGVYLMPGNAASTASLEAVAADIRDAAGTAMVMSVGEPADTRFAELFDRGDDYAALLGEIAAARNGLDAGTATDTLKLTRKLRKAFNTINAMDFFPGEARIQAEAALQELESAVNQHLSPDEPAATGGVIAQLAIDAFQNQSWATRQRPWVDRLASAWLIRRFIDPSAHILWLATPADCPPDALGFDFDGARFSHVGARVTFEVLLASFGLEQPALLRLGRIVHFLDVGGVQPPEAVGIENILHGLHDTLTDDEQLLSVASNVFDGLFASFNRESST